MAERADYAIAIVGGGVVGLTIAALAADAGHDVCLVEPQHAIAPPHGPIGVRTYALTPASRAVLLAVGAWQRLDGSRIGPFTRMEVWDAGSRGRIDFPPPLSHEGAMGYIVEHDALVAALAAVLIERRRVRWHRQAMAALWPGPPPALVLGDNTRIDARLIVGADGARSAVRNAAGIAWHSVPYAQTALCCNIQTVVPHGGIARQRFLADGPIALLPLADNRACSVVWTMAPEAAAALVAAPDEACSTAIGAATESVLGAVTQVGERAAFVLERARAAAYASGGVALAGDAAHVVHPLAGQGLNLGLMDAAALIECIGTPGTHELWPAPAALRRYQRWRKSEALAMMVVTDGLNRLFQARPAPVRLLRGLGMQATARAQPLKAWLIARAMGLTGDLPRLVSDRG